LEKKKTPWTATDIYKFKVTLTGYGRPTSMQNKKHCICERIKILIFCGYYNDHKPTKPK